MTTTVRSADGRVVVDARLRERRVQVHRSRGRRRLRRLQIGAVVIAFGAVAFGLTRSPVLAANTIVVRSGSHVGRAEALRTAGIEKGSPMTDVNAAAAQKRLLALPYVATAIVRRHWPSSVAIVVTERVPVAQVPTGKAWSLVDADGRVLETTTVPVPHLVLLNDVAAPAPGGHVAGGVTLLSFITEMPAGVRDQTASVSAKSSSSVSLLLNDGAVATMGTADHLAAKYVSLETMLAHLPKLPASCTIDVTVPEAPTLTPEEGCA